MINQKLKNSLAFRLPMLYKNLFHLTNKLIYNLKPKPIFDINMVMLCGISNLPFLQQALKSIYDSFESIPHIYMFTDRHLSKQKCQNAIKWFPKEHLTLIEGLECINYHLKKGNNSLAKFANENPMGLKLAAIWQILDNNKPLLYADTDVLWSRDPCNLIQNIIKNEISDIHLSYDFQRSYDQDLISNAKLPGLKCSPYYCAGIMLIKQLTVEHRNLINYILPYALIKSNHFSEQTIFACLQNISGKSALSPEEFSILISDQYKILPSKKNMFTARHYVGPVRHLFWRDAIFTKMKTI